MRILNEVKEIENYLFQKLDGPSNVVFEARLLIDPVLKLRVAWQRKVYSIVKMSGRRKIKSEVESVHRKLFDNPNNRIFQQEIFQLFTKE